MVDISDFVVVMMVDRVERENNLNKILKFSNL